MATDLADAEPELARARASGGPSWSSERAASTRDASRSSGSAPPGSARAPARVMRRRSSGRRRPRTGRASSSAAIEARELALRDASASRAAASDAGGRASAGARGRPGAGALMDERLLTPARRRRALPDQRQVGAARDPPRAAARVSARRARRLPAARARRRRLARAGGRGAVGAARPAAPVAPSARSRSRRAGCGSRRTWAARATAARPERKGSISLARALWRREAPRRGGPMIEKRERTRRDGTRYSVWRVRWRDERGAERSKTFDRAATRARTRRKLRTLKRTGALADLDAGSETLAEFVEEWWRVYAGPNLERATLRAYASLWNGHALPRLGADPAARAHAADDRALPRRPRAGRRRHRGDPQDDDDAPGRPAARRRVGPRADQRREDDAQAAEAAAAGGRGDPAGA